MSISWGARLQTAMSERQMLATFRSFLQEKQLSKRYYELYAKGRNG